MNNVDILAQAFAAAPFAFTAGVIAIIFYTVIRFYDYCARAGAWEMHDLKKAVEKCEETVENLDKKYQPISPCDFHTSCENCKLHNTAFCWKIIKERENKMKEIQKDKYGFTVEKRKFSLRLFFKFLLTLAVCVYAFYRCTLRASADTITLSPSQTVALIGSSVKGSLYSSSTGGYNIDCYAEWTGHTTSEFVSGGYFSNMYIYGQPASYPSFSSAFPNFADRNYLIYAIVPAPSLLAGWVSWDISDSTAHTDFTCNFSLPIESCTSMQFSVLYTAASAYNGIYGNINNSSAILSRSGAVVGRHPLGTASNYNRFALSIWPFCNSYFADMSRVPENARQRLAMIPLDNSSETEFSVSGFSLGLNMVRAPLIDSDSPLYSDHYTLNGFYVPLLLIECPTISDYVPQVTTTVVTTRPQYPVSGAQTAASAQTVDLSYLESGVAAIVEQGIEANNNLDWIGGNVMIGVNNLAYIANRLDDIYNKMWDAGDIPLSAGLYPPSNQYLHDFIVSALATHTNTVSQSSYDLRGGMSTYFDIGNSLLSSPLFRPFVMVAAVGLALAVLAFVLFRGY